MAIQVIASFNTDDDAELRFEGKRYCFYGTDLAIDRTLGTALECYALLRSIEIKELKGGIAEMFTEFIEDAITKHYLDESNNWSCWSGNQEFEIHFITRDPIGF